MSARMIQFKYGVAGFLVAGMLLFAGCREEQGPQGTISILSDQADAEILLNGSVVGKTPHNISGLPVNTYTVELRKSGYNRAYKKIALLEGQKAEVHIPMTQVSGLLLVTSEPAGSDVVIDGEVMGTTPALITELPLGEYNVEIRSVGLPDRTANVEFPDRTPVKLHVQHDPRMAVNSYPPGAEILVDGEVKGVAPLVLEDLPLGEHILTAQLAQYDAQEKTINLMSGLNDAVEFNLEKNSGTLVLDTEPAQVQIFVDGTLFATTQPKEGADSISQPLRIALKADSEHKIQLVREGYTSASLTVKTDIDQVITRHEVLKRIFVYDTLITTAEEVIKCRMEYKLPNGNVYYERYPGVYNTTKAADIIDIQPVSIDDASNREARRLMEVNQVDIPES